MLVINDTQITYHPKRVLIYNKYTILLINETIQFYDSKNHETISFIQRGIKDLCILRKLCEDNKNYAEFILTKYELTLELMTFENNEFKKICKLSFPTYIKDWSCGEDIIYLNTEIGSIIISILNNQLIAKNIQKFYDVSNLQITKLTKNIHNFQYLNTFNLSRYSYNSSLNILKPQELFKTNAIKIVVDKNVVLTVFSNSINIFFNNSHLKDFNIKMPKNIFLFNIHLIKLEENIFRLWNGDGSIIEINIIKQSIEFIFIEKLNCFGLKKSHDIQMKKVGLNEYKRIIKGISESIKPILNTDNQFFKQVVSKNNRIIVLTDRVFVIKIKKGIEKITSINNTTKIIDSTMFYKENSDTNIFIAYQNSIKRINRNIIEKRIIPNLENVCFLKFFTTKNFLLISYLKEYKEEVIIFNKDKNINISQFLSNKSIIKNIWEVNNSLIIYLQNRLLVFVDEENIKFYNFLESNEILNIETFKDNILIQLKKGGCIFLKEFKELEKGIIDKSNKTESIFKYNDNVYILYESYLSLTTEDFYFQNKNNMSEMKVLINWDFTNLPKIICPKTPIVSKDTSREIQTFQIIEIHNHKRPKHFRLILILEIDYEIIIYEKCGDNFYKKHQFISKGYKLMYKKEDLGENQISGIIFYPNTILLNTSNGLVLRDLNIHIYENEVYNINEYLLKNFLSFFELTFQHVGNEFIPLLYFNSNEISILSINNLEESLINIKPNKNIEFMKATEDYICLVVNKKGKIEYPCEESFSNEVMEGEEEKENIIRKTTNLLITKKYEIEIFKTKDLKKTGSLKIDINEAVTDLVIKKGFQTDNFLENQTKNDENFVETQTKIIKNFLYLTTTKSIGRNLQSIGTIYLFDLETLKLIYKEENDVIIKSINVFDFPIQPMKSYNLLSEFNSNPRNPSNINHFYDTKNRNVLIVGCGDQLKIYNSHIEFMEPIAFYDLNQLIERIFCIKNFIIVVDRKMGIHLFFLQLEPIQLHLLSSSNLPVESLLINFNSKTFLRTLNILNNENILKHKLFVEIENENELFFITKSLLNTSLNVFTYSPNNIKGQELVFRNSYDMNFNVTCRGNIMFSDNSIFETCEYNFLKEDLPFYLFDKFIEILLMKQQSDLNILNEYKIKSFDANKTPMVETKILKNFLSESMKYKAEVCKIVGLEYAEIICILSRIFY